MSGGQGDFMVHPEPNSFGAGGGLILSHHISYSPTVGTGIQRSGSDYGSSSGLGGMKDPTASAGSDSGSSERGGEEKPLNSSKQSAASSSGKGSSTGTSPNNKATSHNLIDQPGTLRFSKQNRNRVSSPHQQQNKELELGGSCGSAPSTSSTLRDGPLESPISPHAIPRHGVLVSSGEVIPGAVGPGCAIDFEFQIQNSGIQNFAIPPPNLSTHPSLHYPHILPTSGTMPAAVPGVNPPLYTMTLGKNVEVLHPVPSQQAGIPPLNHQQHFPPLLGMGGAGKGSSSSSIPAHPQPPSALHLTRSPQNYSPSPAVQQQNGPIPSSAQSGVGGGGGGGVGGGGGGPGSSGGGSRGSTSPPALNGPPNGLPSFPCPPTVGQHAVYVHVNLGETLSVRVGNDIQHIAGPATVRMVSQNAGPPVPLPLHVPPGHIVQQIVDDQGTLKHLILSPQAPTTMLPHHGYPPVPGQYPVPSPVLTPHTPCPERPRKAHASECDGRPPEISSTVSDDEDAEKLTQMLSKILPPEILEIGPREAWVQWQVLDCSEASASGGPFPYIDSSEFTYELLVSEKKPDVQISKIRCSSDETKKWLYGLKPSTDYFIRVRADLEDRQLKGAPSAPIGFRSKPTHPDKPHPPGLTKRGKNFVFLSWKKPCDNGAKISSYHLEIDEGKGCGEEKGFREVYNGVVESFRINKLSPNTLYRVRLSASNQYGTSDYSDPLLVQTSGAPPEAPEAPQLLQATSTSLQLAWKKRTGDEDFTLFMEEPMNGHGFIPAVATRETVSTVEGLEQNWEYRFRLMSANEDGKSPSSEIVAFRTTPGKPHAPSKPYLKDRVKANSVKIAWDPPKDTGGTGISAYQLEYAAEDASAGPKLFTQIFEGPERDFYVTKLMPGSGYKFRLSCSGPGGQSGWSEALQITTTALPPSAPPQPSLLKIKPTSLYLRWGQSEDSGGSEIMEYELMMSSTETSQTQSVYKGQKHECTVGNLLPGRKYGFRVRASNRAGPGHWSEQTEALTAPGPPSAPSALRLLSQPSSSSLSLQWDPPQQTNGAEITEYRLLKAVRKFVSVEGSSERGVDEEEGSSPPSPGGSVTAASASNESSHSEESSSASEVRKDYSEFQVAYVGPLPAADLRGLNPASAYLFKVCAGNGTGHGPYSDSLNCQTCPGPPDPPVGLQHEPLSTTSIRVYWTLPVSNGSPITGYVMEWANADQSPQSISLTADATQHTLEDLLPETSYKIRIQAVNEIGAGEWSSSIKGSTFSRPPSPPVIELVVVADKSLKLRWTDTKTPAGDEVYSYDLQMENKSGVFSPIYNGANKNHKVQKLAERSKYKFRIRASSPTGGTGPWSDSYVFQTLRTSPPAIKGPVKVTQIKDSTWQVEWVGVKAPPSLPPGDKIHYLLQITPFPPSSADSWELAYQGPAQSFMLTKLRPGVVHQVRVLPVRLSPISKEDEGRSGDTEVVETYGDKPVLSEPFPRVKDDAKVTSGREGAEGSDGENSAAKEGEETSGQVQPISDTQWALIILTGFSLVAILIAFLVEWCITKDR